MRTFEEYYQRTLIMKKVIETDYEIQKILKSIFNHALNVPNANPLESRVLDPVYGSVHCFYRFGKIINPLIKEEFLPLGIKFNVKCPYRYNNGSERLDRQLLAYAEAFTLGQDPPYFVAAVISDIKIRGYSTVGILMEDISDYGRVELLEDNDHEYCIVKNENSERRKFIDPERQIVIDRNNGLFLRDDAIIRLK